MTDDREPFREAREHGLKARQERRLENATYTAAEVKVLTEAALRLGRKEALAEVYGEMSVVDDWVLDDPRIRYVDVQIDKDTYRELKAAFQPSPEPSGYSDLPPDRQAVRRRYPHAHVCATCSPDGLHPGPGCINCRQTGWDQTPCQAEGHKPQCPHGCCSDLPQDSQAGRSPQEEYSDLEYATRLDGTTMPAPRVLPNEHCWCGGEVGARSPGDHLGLGCLADITHNWNAASQESQDLIEAEQAFRSPYDCRNCEDSDPGSLHSFDEHCGADKCEPGCFFFAPHPTHPCGRTS